MSLSRKLSRKPRLFLSVTGMNLHQFQTILPQFERADNKFERRRTRKVVVTGQKRRRGIGGGAQFANDLSDRLLMLLFYYRLYLTQELMTLLFRAENKSVICRAIQMIRPVVKSVLPVPDRARQRILSLADKEQKRRTKRIGYHKVEYRKGRIQDLRLDLALVDVHLAENHVASAADLARFNDQFHSKRLQRSTASARLCATRARRRV